MLAVNHSVTPASSLTIPPAPDDVANACLAHFFIDKVFDQIRVIHRQNFAKDVLTLLQRKMTESMFDQQQIRRVH